MHRHTVITHRDIRHNAPIESLEAHRSIRHLQFKGDIKKIFVNGLKITHYKTPPEHAIIIPHTGGVIHDTKATARLGQSC